MCFKEKLHVNHFWESKGKLTEGFAGWILLE